MQPKPARHSDTGQVRLNLGSGNVRVDGYMNVDLYDKTADVKADLAELPFEDNSVEHIICDQVIEHIPYNKSEAVFKEMHRVLKPGCQAKVSTPDMLVICQRVVDSGDISENTIINMVGEYYRPWDKSRYDDWEMCAAAIHRNPYALKRLEREALSAGFESVVVTQQGKEWEEDLICILTKPA